MAEKHRINESEGKAVSEDLEEYKSLHVSVARKITNEIHSESQIPITWSSSEESSSVSWFAQWGERCILQIFNLMILMHLAG